MNFPIGITEVFISIETRMLCNNDAICVLLNCNFIQFNKHKHLDKFSDAFKGDEKNLKLACFHKNSANFNILHILGV